MQNLEVMYLISIYVSKLIIKCVTLEINFFKNAIYVIRVYTRDKIFTFVP